MMSDCPFCNLEHKTDWYMTSKGGITVCRDLRNKGYKYRLLVVCSGSSQWHEEVYSDALQEWMVKKGKEVANAHIRNGWAEKIAKVDFQMSIPGHWHCQICME